MYGFLNVFLGPARKDALDILGAPVEASLKEKSHKPSVFTVKWEGLDISVLDHPLIKEGTIVSFDLGIIIPGTVFGIQGRIKDDYRIKSIARGGSDMGNVVLTLTAHDKSIELSDKSVPVSMVGVRGSEFAARVAGMMGLGIKAVQSPIVRDAIVVGDKATLAHKLTEVAAEEGYQWYITGSTLFYEPIEDPSKGKVTVLPFGQGLSSAGAFVQSWSDSASSVGRAGGKKRKVTGKNPDGSKSGTTSQGDSGQVVVVNYTGKNKFQEVQASFPEDDPSITTQSKSSGIRNAAHRASANKNAQKFIAWRGQKLKFVSYGTLLRPRQSVRLDGLHSSGQGPWRIEGVSTKWGADGSISQSVDCVTPPKSRSGKNAKGKGSGKDGDKGQGDGKGGPAPLLIEYTGKNKFRTSDDG